MRKLMKYELRKTMFSKMILLAVTAVAEAAYLLGVFLNRDAVMAGGMTGLVCCALVGLFYIGVESLVIFQKELNTKQSYMLFLTPRNSYQILGAKVLENGISIFLTGGFYALLAALDITVGILYIGGLKELLDVISEAMKFISIEIDISTGQITGVFFACLASWLMMIVIGNLAIVMSATVFAGKKFSGFVSFLLYLVIAGVSGRVLNAISSVAAAENTQYLVTIAGAFLISGVMYLLAGWIMERRLSV